MVARFHAGISCLLLTACVGIARIKNLPRSASQIPFDEIASRATRVDGIWNLQTDCEYFIEIGAHALEVVHKGLEEAVGGAGYEVVRSGPEQSTVLGQRGLRLNEWKPATCFANGPSSAARRSSTRGAQVNPSLPDSPMGPMIHSRPASARHGYPGAGRLSWGSLASR